MAKQSLSPSVTMTNRLPWVESIPQGAAAFPMGQRKRIPCGLPSVGFMVPWASHCPLTSFKQGLAWWSRLQLCSGVAGVSVLVFGLVQVEKAPVFRGSQKPAALRCVRVNQHHQRRKAQFSGQFSGKLFVRGKAFSACVQFRRVQVGNKTGGGHRRSGGE